MKRKMSFLFTVCLLIGALSGCGKTTEATAAGEKKTLEMWYYWGGSLQEVLNTYVEEFNAQSQKTTIVATYVPYGEYTQKVLTSVAGGKTPDILIYGNNETATLAEAGVLGVMTDSVKKGGFEDRILPEVLKAHEYNGEYYGLPIYANCLALFYNKNMVSKAPETWDELKTTAAEISNENTYALAVSAIENEEGIFQFLPWLWSAGADLDSLDSSQGVAALQLYKDLIEKGYMSKEVLSWTQQDAMVQFSSGRAAMMVNGPWNVSAVREAAPDMDFGVTVLPAMESGKSASILGGESFGVAVGADMEAADEFFSWIYSKGVYSEFLKALGQMPAEESMLMDDYYQNDPVQKAFADNLLVAKPRAYGPAYNEMSGALQVAVTATLSGSKTPEEAMKEAASVIDPLLPR